MTPEQHLYGSILLLPFALTGCGGSPPPTMEGRAGMLSRTAVAQKCGEAAKGHDRPFVVEWDATDLASFEAKAARDTIVVHYEGCKIEVLYGCSDPAAPGRLGAYGTPQFTSGTVQGFDVKNEGDLYAKLPLGAAELSARVAAGETLHLKYLVSGVATSSRDTISREELAGYPGCEGATHYVWGYNLGAFELSSTEQTSVEGKAGVGSIGGGARRAHEEAAVGAGGNLASCTTQDQRACRVPIRLALRPIAAGKAGPIVAQQNAAPERAHAAPADDSGAPSEATGRRPRSRNASADEALGDAWRKLDVGDGAACAASATRALGLDPRLNDDFAFKVMRATCLMRAGKCDDGTRDYRAALATADYKREKTDRQLDREARETANENCPSATSKSDSDYLSRAYLELKAADKVADGKTCKAIALKTYEISKRMHASPPKATSENPMAQMDFEHGIQDASNILLHASSCVARASHKCSDGQAIYRLQYTVIPKPMADWEKAADEGWKRTVQATKLDCK
jgi:hypothetical protein